MRKWLAIVAISLSALLSSGYSAPARAGIPVIDVASLAEAIQNTLAWIQQYQQMVQQYEQLRQQYQALTGSRNLGEILNNPLLRDSVPPDVMQIYNAVQTGGINGLTAAARTIRQRMLIYDCDDRTGDDQTRCRAILNHNAQRQAFTQGAFERVTQRIDQIEALMRQINLTDDPKSIAELQARIQIETTAIGNEQSRIALLNQMSQAQRDQSEQSVKEAAMKNLSLTSDGSSGYGAAARGAPPLPTRASRLR